MNSAAFLMLKYGSKLWGYNIETVMAEKVETILSRGIRIEFL